MKKRNLEKDIIDSVYTFEKKRTATWILKFTTIVLVLGTALIFASMMLFQYFVQSNTFDVFDIFSEDIDTIRMYILQVFDIVYQETPPELLIPIVILLILSILSIARNSKVIKNRVLAIVHYRNKKTS